MFICFASNFINVSAPTKLFREKYFSQNFFIIYIYRFFEWKYLFSISPFLGAIENFGSNFYFYYSTFISVYSLNITIICIIKYFYCK